MWMPVIIFCGINSGCNFWTKDIYDTQAECETIVMSLLVKLDADPVIEFTEGVCLPVKLKQV